MEFTDEEIKIIYSVLEICIQSVSWKKHKSKNDILALHKMEKISEKINNYMEGKENGISRNV